MINNNILQFGKQVLNNMPSDWLNLTTHRLDIYNEKLAKTEFLEHFETLFEKGVSDAEAINELPTAFDYIRLGHPLSCMLEWMIAKSIGLPSDNVISFSSQITPILAILRKNALTNKNTILYYTNNLPDSFDADIIRDIYEYSFEVKKVDSAQDISSTSDTSAVFLTKQTGFPNMDQNAKVDFYIHLYDGLGSVLTASTENNDYVSEIQHVRRRETIAMTPENCLVLLQAIIQNTAIKPNQYETETNKSNVLSSIQEITESPSKPLVGSSGLSVQYAIMMGLVHDAKINHPNKAIRFIVPPNCYGGTNDQARRVAACIENVEVVDFPVDGEHEMVTSLDAVLDTISAEDAVPYIIAEIPTNPRVEVPDLDQLKAVLSKERKTAAGNKAIDPVFILDQTFCPNVHFLGKGEILSTVRALSYASGSKFPSGGKCTAGYVVGNENTNDLMEKIELHMTLCDNEATGLQYDILAKQLPSMNQRIQDAYVNTRAFVNYIKEVLPSAKINFVPEELAEQGFTPSVFSLDLPTYGANAEEREMNKRALNLRLINLMITEIPNESKYCVSYGQLKGCYWTIPATSTQGTTKEGDKDYIARVALSANMDLEKHKAVFGQFVQELQGQM